MKAGLAAQPVAGLDDQPQNGGTAGGQHRTEHPHAQRKNEHIVQQDVHQAAGERGGHGPAGGAIVAHKADHQVVEQKDRRKHQQYPQIGAGQLPHMALAAQQPGEAGCAQCPQQEKEHGGTHGGLNRRGKHTVGVPVLALAGQKRKLGGPAHAKHQAGAVHDVVQGHRQIQRGQTVGPDALGHEKGIGQNVKRQPQHCRYVQRDIAGVFLKRRMLVHGGLLPQSTKTPRFCIFKGLRCKTRRISGRLPGTPSGDEDAYYTIN